MSCAGQTSALVVADKPIAEEAAAGRQDQPEFSADRQQSNSHKRL